MKKNNFAYSNILWTSSIFFIIPSLIAFYNKHYDISLLSFILIISSCCFWSNPVKNTLARKIDVIYVRTLQFYKIYKTFKLNKQYIILPLITLYFIIYLLSCYTKNKKDYTSFYFHLLFHILANISTIILVFNP